MTITWSPRVRIRVVRNEEAFVAFEVEEARDLADEIRQAESNIAVLEKRGKEKGALKWWRKELKVLREIAELEI